MPNISMNKDAHKLAPVMLAVGQSRMEIDNGMHGEKR